MSNENIKVTCSLDNSFNSDKFLKLRLNVCHDGINKNAINFSIDAIQKAKDSIQLIPILARVIQDENGEYQFSGHDMTLETNAFDETQTKMIYKEVPVGFIPKECNYAIEQIDGRSHVLVDGYVWKEYSNYAQDIIERDETINLSMEISVNDYQETTCDEQNVLDITDFTYMGITLLGNDIQPAMEGACAKLVNFSLDRDVSEIIEEMCKELDSIIEEENSSQSAVDEDKECFETLKKSYELQKQEIENLYNQIEELSQFKANVLQEQKHNDCLEVISKWSTYLEDNEEFSKLKDSMDSYSVEDLEVKCKCIFADVQAQAIATKNAKHTETNNVVNFSFGNQNNIAKVESEKDLLIKKYLNA